MSRPITSFEGFARKIRKVQPDDEELLLYRGHADRKIFKLIPSVFRSNNLANAEHRILRELVASHPKDFTNDLTTLEQLVRAQHYSLPTRLLDVTWNPLVALYFACKEHKGSNGEVIVLRINKTLVKFYDSDTVACIANLAHLKPEERSQIDFGLKSEEFNRQPSIDRLLQFIRNEKGHFRADINPKDLQSVKCVMPKKNNQRILVQSGAFMLFGMINDIDNNIPNGIVIERIPVDGDEKDRILRELDRMAINDSSMFPEIENAAKYIRDRSS